MRTRLQKIISNAGIASRRKAERLILDGRVKVNNRIINILGSQADPDRDKIEVDNTRLSPNVEPETYALYKPKSCITTLDDPRGRETITTYFPKTKARLFPVGRLDYNSEGLVLLTNDGELAHTVAHPRQHVWKRYFVKVKGIITQNDIRKLRPGPVIDGKKRQPVKIELLHHINDKTWMVVSLQEGLKHHIKKMFGYTGFPVLKIKRYSIGNIELREMKPGECRQLVKSEIDELIRLSRGDG
jgi:pseudouridine synthase